MKNKMMAASKKQAFEIAPFDPALHYEMICGWWVKHNWPILPFSSLPQNGRIVFSEDEFLAAGFVYLTDSDIAWTEFIISNPDASPIMRARSIMPLIESLCLLAKEKGCRIVFMALENKRLIEKLLEQGFILGDKNMTHLVKVLR